jgi:hypothetical protein
VPDDVGAAHTKAIQQTGQVCCLISDGHWASGSRTAGVTTSVITDQLITGQRGLIHQGRERIRAKRKMDEGNGFTDTPYLILKLHSVGDQAKHDQASGRTPLPLHQ